MNAEEFEKIFEDVVGSSREMLIVKAKMYANDDDRLRNFRLGAQLTRSTPEQTLWGYLVKHLISVTDMIESGAHYSPEVWDEKIGDTINYFILLRAQVYESESTEDEPSTPTSMNSSVGVVQHVHPNHVFTAVQEQLAFGGKNNNIQRGI